MDDISRPPSDGEKPTYERRSGKRRGARRKGDREAQPPELAGDRGVIEDPVEEDPAPADRGVVEQPAEEKATEEKASEEQALPPEIDLDAGTEEDPPPLKDPEELAKVLFSVLLVNREPISKLRLAQTCGASQRAVVRGLDALDASLRDAGFPVQVSRVGESVRLLTSPEVFPYLKRLGGVKKAERLSPAALETLAVVAYRQPVMRGEIEAIRGVKVGPTLRTLLDHKLVDVVGRADVPGRPLQYGTTQHFLDRFGLPSLKELPSVREFKSL